MRRPRVLLADDHQGVLDSVARLLTPEFDVVAQVRNGRELLDRVSELWPDVCVIDISMPIIGGIDAAKTLGADGIKTKIIFLTVYEDQDFVNAAMAAGAQGYVIKSRIAEDLCEAIRRALTGALFISPIQNSS